jgi:hypothetical protein
MTWPAVAKRFRRPIHNDSKLHLWPTEIGTATKVTFAEPLMDVPDPVTGFTVELDDDAAARALLAKKLGAPKAVDGHEVYREAAPRVVVAGRALIVGDPYQHR